MQSWWQELNSLWPGKGERDLVLLFRVTVLDMPVIMMQYGVLVGRR
jgi:hypothetical protein